MYAYQAAAEREAAANVKMPTAFEGSALLEGAWGCDDGGGRATAVTPMLTGEEEILGESLCVCDLWGTSLCRQQTLIPSKQWFRSRKTGTTLKFCHISPKSTYPLKVYEVCFWKEQ